MIRIRQQTHARPGRGFESTVGLERRRGRHLADSPVTLQG